jgi:hypothetical protein
MQDKIVSWVTTHCVWGLSVQVAEVAGYRYQKVFVVVSKPEQSQPFLSVASFQLLVYCILLAVSQQECRPLHLDACLCRAVYSDIFLTCISLCRPVVKPDSIMAWHQCRSLSTIEVFNVFTLCFSAHRLPTLSVQGTAGTLMHHNVVFCFYVLVGCHNVRGRTVKCSAFACVTHCIRDVRRSVFSC